ncbi:MAG: hypothetical protein ACOYL8_02350 [Patescibacteria group bacterium]
MERDVFFVFYGLAETINAIYVYRLKKEWFNLWATSLWGISFVLVGMADVLDLSISLKIAACVLFGLTWFPMMGTPCAIKFLRKNQKTLLLRKIMFAIIGAAILIIAFYK